MNRKQAIVWDEERYYCYFYYPFQSRCKMKLFLEKCVYKIQPNSDILNTRTRNTCKVIIGYELNTGLNLHGNVPFDMFEVQEQLTTEAEK